MSSTRTIPQMLKSTEPTFNQYVGNPDDHDTGTAPQ